MTYLISFPGAEQTSIAEVGGKGYELIRMVKAVLPVPPGAVLTTNFFAPWFDEIQASATWTALADATPDKWATLCNELMGLCPALPLTATQWQALTGSALHVMLMDLVDREPNYGYAFWLRK